MGKVSEFLAKSELYLTLTNEEGETFEAGQPEDVRSFSNKTVMRWKVGGKYENTFPFTLAVLHGTKKVLDAREIRPILPSTETVIELEYV